MSKSLEALDLLFTQLENAGKVIIVRECNILYNTIKRDLERLKKLEKDYNLLDTTMESDDRIICELLKEKEQLQNDIKLNETQIDDLTLEVANYKHALEEKNEIIMDLKKENQELLVNKNFAQGVALKYKKAIEKEIEILIERRSDSYYIEEDEVYRELDIIIEELKEVLSDD